MTSRLRHHREQAGLTQGELALRSGLSRQMVGAVESGRHLPRVDAAQSLARALGVPVSALFPVESSALDVLTGRAPEDGSPVRVGRVGDQVVTAPARIDAEGWDVADGYVERGRVEETGRCAPGLVVAGCEPGLQMMERLLREKGHGALAVLASSQAALRALAAGRAHAAVVHGPTARRRGRSGTIRFGLAAWRVGLAAPRDSPRGWWRAALAGRVPVVQREEGAAVQRSFASLAGDDVPGPRAGSHVEAARRATWTGLAAVTIEPAAAAMGAAFHPLEAHTAELWVDERWVGTREVGDALDLLGSESFRRRLELVGGYDLTGMGARVG